jgi:hypothetical protein
MSQVSLLSMVRKHRRFDSIKLVAVHIFSSSHCFCCDRSLALSMICLSVELFSATCVATERERHSIIARVQFDVVHTRLHTHNAAYAPDRKRKGIDKIESFNGQDRLPTSTIFSFSYRFFLIRPLVKLVRCCCCRAIVRALKRVRCG